VIHRGDPGIIFPFSKSFIVFLLVLIRRQPPARSDLPPQQEFTEGDVLLAVLQEMQVVGREDVHLQPLDGSTASLGEARRGKVQVEPLAQ